MKGSELLKKLRKLADKKGVTYDFVPGEGKGSHGTVYYGDRRSTVKDRKKEIHKNLLANMCRQLGISPSDLN